MFVVLLRRVGGPIWLYVGLGHAECLWLTDGLVNRKRGSTVTHAWKPGLDGHQIFPFQFFLLFVESLAQHLLIYSPDVLGLLLPT